MDKRTVAVRILAVVALVFTALAAVGWVVFLGGFGYLTSNRPDFDASRFTPPSFRCHYIFTLEHPDRSVITGPCWDPYWVISVLSPILFIVLIVKAILLLIKEELFRKFFIIHILAVLAFIITVIVLCFLGYLLALLRITIQGAHTFQPSTTTVPSYINAIFAGVLLEAIFLGAAWICHILAFLFGGLESKKE